LSSIFRHIEVANVYIVGSPNKTVHELKKITHTATHDHQATHTQHVNDITTTITVKHTLTSTHFVRTVTTTKVHTSTTTHTAAPAKETFYAACASTNLLGYTYSTTDSSSGVNDTMYSNSTTSSRHPVGINAVNYAVGQPTIDTKAGTAYACCAACVQLEHCFFSTFSHQGVCSIYTSDRGSFPCESQTGIGNFFGLASDPLAAGAGLIISNGMCGTLQNEGIQSGSDDEDA